MPLWNPHMHTDHKRKDFAWMLEVLKTAFWKISTEKIGNTLKVHFIPGSEWMGKEITETLSMEQGAKGDKGDKGDRGFKGDKGDKGEQGERGLPGDGVYSCGFKTFTKVTADRALQIGRVSHVGGSWCNAFLLSVYVECGGVATGSNFQAYNTIIVTDRTGVNFIPVSYNCNKYENGASSAKNEYWLKGVSVTYSNVGATPNAIYLHGTSESLGLVDVGVHWSIMPFMGTAESLDESFIDASDIPFMKQTHYI